MESTTIPNPISNPNAIRVMASDIEIGMVIYNPFLEREFRVGEITLLTLGDQQSLNFRPAPDVEGLSLRLNQSAWVW